MTDDFDKRIDELARQHDARFASGVARQSG